MSLRLVHEAALRLADHGGFMAGSLRVAIVGGALSVQYRSAETIEDGEGARTGPKMV